MKTSKKSQSSKSSGTLRNKVSGAQKRKGVSRELEAAPQTKEGEVSENEITEAKKKPKSEKTENIIAIAIFVLLIVIGAAIFTKGFGLFAEKDENGDSNARVMVPIGNDPYIGESGAKVVIVAFSDYECPFCARGEEVMKQVREMYKDDVVYVFKDFPLTRIHPNSYNAALAAECGKEQDKYWEYHELLWEHNTQLEDQYLKSYAEQLGLDTSRFNECFDTQLYKAEVDKDIQTASLIGVSAAPTFFIGIRASANSIDAVKIVGAKPIQNFVEVIDSELKR